MDKLNGIITEGVGGLYRVRLDITGEYVSCRARGAFRHEGITPLVGDRVWVALSEPKEGKSDDNRDRGAVIDEILERKNSLIRPPLANLDLLFLTLAVHHPEPSLPTVDKLLSICEYNSIDAVVVIGKCELDPARAEEIAGIYRLAGYRTVTVSCFEKIGIRELDEYVGEALDGGRIAAFSGASGAGKSTLINTLFPDFGLETGEVSRKTERGRHTTRSVRLFEARGGYLADTPGFSMIDFARFDFFGKDDLPGTFREFSDCIGKCRYKKCTHTKEEGCAVLEKLREGKIAPSRHESFLELYSILKEKHDWSRK